VTSAGIAEAEIAAGEAAVVEPSDAVVADGGSVVDDGPAADAAGEADVVAVEDGNGVIAVRKGVAAVPAAALVVVALVVALVVVASAGIEAASDTAAEPDDFDKPIAIKEQELVRSHHFAYLHAEVVAFVVAAAVGRPERQFAVPAQLLASPAAEKFAGSQYSVAQKGPEPS